MVSPENCPDVENPQVDLRPLVFGPKKDNGKEAVFQALIDDSDAPGAPMYALTVTTASLDDKEEAEFRKFLDEMRAGFVLTAPNPDEEPCDDKEPDPFNIDTQTQFEPDLVRLTLNGNFGITAVVQTAVIGESPEAEGPVTDGPIRYRARVQAGKEHRYTAVRGLKTATVTARQGRGTIRRPTKDIVAGGDGRSLRARVVVVHGVTLCVYDFVGRFNRTS
jgi:hypothetical protein